MTRQDIEQLLEAFAANSETLLSELSLASHLMTLRIHSRAEHSDRSVGHKQTISLH